MANVRWALLMSQSSKVAELAERWRVAGEVLRRIDPVMFRALLKAAETDAVDALDLADLDETINLVHKIC